MVAAAAAEETGWRRERGGEATDEEGVGSVSELPHRHWRTEAGDVGTITEVPSSLLLELLRPLARSS